MLLGPMFIISFTAQLGQWPKYDETGIITLLDLYKVDVPLVGCGLTGVSDSGQ